jgi:alpha(1,3/1,4) fucosyltransferase
MKVGFYNYYDSCNNNNMFKDPSVFPMGDDLTYPFVHLFERAKSEGIDISTIDTQPLESYDMIFFFDFPKLNNQYFKKLIESKFENLIFFIYENEVIMSENWDKRNYSYFKKVYTWNDKLVDNKKVFKYYFPIKIPKNFVFDTYKREKLCVMIAWNKLNKHKLELYSKRVEAIRWFEKNHSEDFDLYGLEWDTKAFEADANIWGTDEAEIRKNSRPDELPFISYKGPVESKNDILKHYKFSICYENARDIPGYITEKIFDSFFAGCIPIYWGASNVTDYIPPETFIDKRKFDSYADLYHYIKNMPEETYQGYLNAIEMYINSDKIYPFSAESFADTILNEIHENRPKKNLFSYIKSLLRLFKHN